MSALGRPDSYRPMLIADGVRSSALRTPDKLAIECAGQRISYRDLIRRVDRVATAASVDLGLRSGDHAAVMAGNSIEFMEIALGLASIGVAAAMLNTRFSPEEAAFVCSDAGARALFVAPDLSEAMGSVDLPSVQRTIVVGEEYERWLADAHGSLTPSAIEEWETFSIPYTAGTTGQPKGVLLSHRSRVTTMFAMGIEFGCYGPSDRALAVAPMYHGAGFAFALAPIFFGGSLLVHERFDPELLLRDLADWEATNVFLVPTHFQAVFSLGQATLEASATPALRTIISNAAPLSQPMKERIVEKFGGDVLFECYGSTEAAIVSALRPADQLIKQSCVGQPFPLTEVILRDEAGVEVGPGEVGELFSRSPYLFTGYWQRPQETAVALGADGFCTSGDLAMRDEDGHLYIVDRKNDKIISGGVNIFPREIEDTLLRHPAVSEVAVYGVPDDYWGEAVEATIVPKAGVQLDVEELLVWAQALGRYKLPRHVAVADTLPRNAAGKVLRRELRVTAAARRAGEAEKPPSA